jgi:hypothetical protein
LFAIEITPDAPRSAFLLGVFFLFDASSAAENDLRDEGGAGAVVEAVDGEIAGVDGEDFAEVLALGDAEDGGVFTG